MRAVALRFMYGCWEYDRQGIPIDRLSGTFHQCQCQSQSGHRLNRPWTVILQNALTWILWSQMILSFWERIWRKAIWPLHALQGTDRKKIISVYSHMAGTFIAVVGIEEDGEHITVLDPSLMPDKYQEDGVVTRSLQRQRPSYNHEGSGRRLSLQRNQILCRRRLQEMAGAGRTGCNKRPLLPFQP